MVFWALGEEMQSNTASSQRRAPRVGDLSDSANCVLRVPSLSVEDLEIANVSELGALVVIQPAAANHQPQSGQMLEGTLVLGDYFLIRVTARVAYVARAEGGKTKIGVEFMGISSNHQALIRACFRHELAAVSLKPDAKAMALGGNARRFRNAVNSDWIEIDLGSDDRSLKRVVARTSHLSIDWNADETQSGPDHSELKALKRMLRNLPETPPEIKRAIEEL